jgi:hypothetical protein
VLSHRATSTQTSCRGKPSRWPHVDAPDTKQTESTQEPHPRLQAAPQENVVVVDDRTVVDVAVVEVADSVVAVVPVDVVVVLDGIVVVVPHIASPPQAAQQLVASPWQTASPRCEVQRAVT